MSFFDPRAHWEKHDVLHPIDRENDPLGLQNVCIPSESKKINAYHNSLQERVFIDLLYSIQSPLRRTGTAVDIGCGAGRWCQRLYDSGCNFVTGIDFQKNLIENNKERFKGYGLMEFLNMDFREYNPLEKVDLITSVTVLQHLPFLEVIPAFNWARRVLKIGGHLLMLENTTFESDTVFSLSIPRYLQMAKLNDLKILRVIPYDHSLALRSVNRLGAWIKEGAAEIDSLLDPILRSANLYWMARHAGFLFQKV